MSKDNASIAPSEATTLINDDKPREGRTTLTGKPIKYEHDNLGGMMLGDGGGFAARGVGANLLPPGYTDKSLVRIPIKMSDVEDAPATESDVKTEKKGGFLGMFSSKRKEANEDIKVVMMSRGEYLKYCKSDSLLAICGMDPLRITSCECLPCGIADTGRVQTGAKGNDGKFLDSVVEPPDGRKELLRKQLELNEEMKRNDPSLGKQSRSSLDSSKVVSGGAQLLSNASFG